jgi:two-component system LytT family response regulator
VIEILVVDDEALARSAVIRQLGVLLPDAHVREARDGFEALERIAEVRPVLLFLDVEMPELSGLDLLGQIAEPRPRVIFVTAHDHFAVRAFEDQALDYLVKPFTPERFARAVERAMAAIDTDAKLRSVEQRIDRLALRRGSALEVVLADAIVCLVSEDHYTHVRANGHVYVTELSLQHFEQRLDPARFVRAHRNAIVNVAHVARLTMDGVVMDDGTMVAVSRRCRAALTAALG